MAFLRYLFRVHPLAITLTLMVSVVNGVLSAVLIGFIQRGLHTPGSMLGVGGLIFAGLCLVQLGMRISAQKLLASAGQRAVDTLRLRLIRRIISTPLHQQESVGFGRLMSMFTEDIAALHVGVQGCVVVTVSAAVVIACFTYVSWMVPRIGATVALLLISGGGINALVRRAGRRTMLASRKMNERLLGQIRGVLSGAKELKLHRERREAFVEQALLPAALEQSKYVVRGMTLLATSVSFTQLLTFALLGGLFVLPFLSDVPRPGLSACVLAILYMMSRVDQLSGSTMVMVSAGLALERIDSLGFSILTPETDTEALPPRALSPGRIVELFGVTHSYQSETDRFVLGPIDFSVRAGEIVFIVGGNGSGKSTLAKLLTGLYTPMEGSLSIDGQPVDTSTRDWYRQHFSAVFSDFHVFDQLYGIPPANLDERAGRYLAKLQLDHKVAVRDGVFSTTALSLGQQKRLALLVSYLEGRPFYLFDEWAADQDPTFRKLFYTELLPELKRNGKGVVVITHDDQYFHIADRVVRLNYGKIENEPVPLAQPG